MLTSTILAAANNAAAPLEWTPTIGAIMVACNIFAIAFTKLSGVKASEGPALPAGNLFGGFSAAGLLASTAFGHILGIGVILGLHSLGRF